mgnify:CR=1 FL=1
MKINAMYVLIACTKPIIREPQKGGVYKKVESLVMCSEQAEI